FYSSIVYVYLQSMGYHIIGEDVTNKGRIDLTVLFKDKVYIFEFKVDGKRGESLRQIKEKGYKDKYVGKGKEIYLVGMEFDSGEKNIVNYEWERCA
ncbi:MAG: PD-(D/E)XK nuclease domain-containing protein, partial [Spirochaetota bacterium]